jgi:hypothetical protein
VWAWWAENEPYRNSVKSKRAIPNFKFSNAGAENLQKLSQLLDKPTPHNILLRAEIARELGRVDEAAQLLSQDLPAPYEHLGVQIERWVEAGKQKVQPFILADAAGVISLAI